jgi:hypothetical protein
MIGELRVRPWNLIFRHVARHTFAGAHRTSLAWMIAGSLGSQVLYGIGAGPMTGQALFVIRRGVAGQGVMWIVASDASEATIAVAPTTTLFEAIRLKPHVCNAYWASQGNVPRRTMARPAKVHRIDRVELPRV